jgi:predicted DNA binding protein
MFGLKRFRVRLSYNEFVRPWLDVFFKDIEYVVLQQQFTASPKDFILLCEIQWKKKMSNPQEELSNLKKDIEMINDVTVIKTDRKRTLCFIKGIHHEMYTALFSYLTKEFLCFIEYPMVAREDYGIINLVGPPKDVTRLIEAMRDFGSILEIIAVKGYSTKDRGILSVLTDKQLSMLKDAYAQGFFDNPRRKSAREISGKMGIAHTTFLAHIRKSQNRIFSALFEE